jgi:hypothetical protein
MHDIDRTTFETGFDEYESDEYEYGFEGEDQEEESYEMYDEGEMYGESPFTEAEEMELAAELLSISSEEELDQFIGKLLKKAGRAAGKFIKSPIGRQLGGIIKGAAKSALPMIGSALGNVLLPGVGGAIGGKLASSAGSMLGLELEGLSQEDQEFEIARQIVRFGGAAASNAAEVAPTTSPQQAAQTAAVTAAQQYAPGLLKANTGGATGKGGCRCGRRRNGRWIRNGRNIIIIGA